MRARWRSAGPTLAGGGEGEHERRRDPRRSPIRTASRRTAATASFTLANGRGGNVDQASPLAREPFIAVAELTGSAAQGRIVLAAPIALDEIEARFADRIENRDEVTFDEKSLSLRARRSRRLGAIALAEQTRKVEPNDETARAAGRKASRAPGSTSCRGRKALTQWRDRVMFLRRAEGDEWPDLSDAALAANTDWLAAGLRRQDGGVATLAR